MAEKQEPRKRSEERVKLFVGQVPKHATEDQLIEMFKEFAVVDEVNIIKDKATRASRGCCFVICPSREEADKTVSACHNKTLPGATIPLQVKYADGELERLEHKIFIGMLPKNVSDAEVAALFSHYGIINDLQLLIGSQQTSKGCAFLKYETKEQALAAIEALNGRHKMENSTVPLVVKWADTEKERLARRAQKVMVPNLLNSDSQQHPSLFGALPMSYMPTYNPYGYQTPGAYGIMPYRLSAVQNQHSMHNGIPSVNQEVGVQRITPYLPRRMVPKNFTMSPRSYLGSTYPPLPGVQYPLPYPGGLINNQPFSGSPGAAPPTSRVGTRSESHVEGPPGGNLFIYHIPQDFGDEELANTFHPFGKVLSAKVFMDKTNGISKGFGFVSYDTPEAAQNAISTMNGYQLEGKKLKVQLKRDNNHGKSS